ncbi:hypothetical protein TEA_004895 [Camellia sinensis var. sinensis]|uniref:TNase-like domain-containing protein n=1 Tax=Camellia sinensis var. sinensis TaxID=542762 RepID=A0A4S4F1W9_CAMSN|nr:hypothetical protein TEA_004895 [Camellia sinensis var. sinensis]
MGGIITVIVKFGHKSGQLNVFITIQRKVNFDGFEAHFRLQKCHGILGNFPQMEGSLAVEMASTAGTTGWLRGKVKVVPSGDSLVIMGSTKAEIPPEKTITLSSLIAPRLARRGGIDESFAWESREYLRKLCIGKDVTFRVDYTVPAIGREFGSVFLGDKNVSLMVVAGGWAKLHMVCHFLDVTIHNFIVLALRAAMAEAIKKANGVLFSDEVDLYF